MDTDRLLAVIHDILKILKPIVLILAVGFVYLMFVQKFEIGIPCIFNKLTGLKCPGCGMTHAMVEIWNGNLDAAMQYNALSLTAFPVVCIYAFYRYIKEGIKKNEEFYIWEYVLLVVLLTVAVVYGYSRNAV